MGPADGCESICRAEAYHLEMNEINNNNIMKRFATLLLAVLTAGLLSAGLYAADKKKADIREVTFVTSIDCKNCVKKVEAKLPYEKGVKDLKVNLEDKTVWIKYDASKTDSEKLAAAIVKLGYTAEELTTEKQTEKE